MSGNDAEHPPEEKAAGMARRSCTDPVCFAVFVAYMVGMGYIVVTSMAQGDLKRLTHGFDYTGQLCGVDVNVSHQPYLYWCGGDLPAVNGVPASLNLRSPICVAECPKGPDSPSLYCPMPSETEVSREGVGEALTVTTVIVSRVVPQAPYKTELIGNSYCLPDISSAPQLASSLLEGKGAPLADSTQQMQKVVGSCKRAWRVFIAATLVAIILSYVYLFLLQKMAKVLVYSALIAVVLISILLGLALILTSLNLTGHQADSPIFQRYPHNEAVTYSQIGGAVLLAIGGAFLCVLMCAHSSISTACGCIESACECMFDMPSLLLQPMAAALVKLVVALVLFCGFMFLMSCGTVSSHTARIGGQEINGLKRSFHYTEEQKYMMIYYIFGIYWSVELCNAMNIFIVSYSVVLWYYKPKQGGKKGSPRIPAVRGFLSGMTFHLGSLAFGAFLVALVQLIRTILAAIEHSAKAEGNHVMAMIAGACACFMTCFEQCLKFITKNAYIDIAIHSNSFCTAAKHSFEFISSAGPAIMVLNGACFIMSITGTVSISVACGWLTYIMTTTWERYTSNSSPHWVSDPTAVSILAGALAFAIAATFMVVFDQCADTLLYTYQDNKKTSPGTVDQFAPDTLVGLVSSQAGGKGSGGE